VKIEPFLGLELILTTSYYLERNFCNKILIFFIMDLPTAIKFIKLNLLIHFRGLVPFEVQSYEVRSLSRFGHSKFGISMFSLSTFSLSTFGHFRRSVFRCLVPFDVRSFDVRSHSRFGHSRFGHSRFGLSTFSLSKFGHGFDNPYSDNLMIR
jgi:hypothetical protein